MKNQILSPVVQQSTPRLVHEAKELRILEPLEQRMVLNADGFSTLSAPATTGTGAGPMGMDLHDIGADGGRADYVAANFDANTVTVGMWNAADAEWNTLDVAVGKSPTDVKWVDFQDTTGFASANSADNSITIAKNTGWAYATTKLDLDPGSQPSFLGIGDFNGDGASDIAVTCAGTAKVAVFLNKHDGSGTYNAPTYLTAGTKPGGIAVADFDGDDHSDIAVANEGLAAGVGSVSYFHNKGDGTFDAAVNTNVGKGAAQIAAFHANDADPFHDGVAVTNKGANTVSVLNWNDTTKKFDAGATLVAGKAPVGIGAGDINGDGIDDLAVANSTDNTIGVFHGTATPGAFDTQKIFYTGEKPHYLFVGDYVGASGGGVDGLADIAATCYKDNKIVGMANVHDTPAFSVSIGAGTGVTKLVFTDADGTTVTSTMAGPGAGVFYFDGTGLSCTTAAGVTTVKTTGNDAYLNIGFFNSTTSVSSLVFAAVEKSGLAPSTPGAEIGSLQSLTPVGKITAPAIDINSGIFFESANGFALDTKIRDLADGAAISMDGVSAIAGLLVEAHSFGDDSTLSAGSFIKKLTLGEWRDEKLDGGEWVAAPWIDTLAVAGNLNASMTMWSFDPATGQALKSATVGGNVNGYGGGMQERFWFMHGGGTVGSLAIKGGVGFDGPADPGVRALSINGGGIGSLTVGGDARLRLDANGAHSGSAPVGTVKIGGNFDGNITVSDSGMIAGGIGTLDVGGSLSATSRIDAGYLGTLIVGGSSSADLSLSGRGWNSAATLTSATIKGVGGITSDSNWSIKGGIGTLTAPAAASGSIIQAAWINTLTVANNFDADLPLTGRNTAGNTLGTAKLGSVNAPLGMGWNIDGRVGSVDVTGNFSSALNASSITTLKVGGNYDGILNLSGVGAPATVLGSATIGGNLNSTEWLLGTVGTIDVKGNIGTNLHASAINTLKVGGDVTGDMNLYGRWLTGNNSLNSATIGGYVTSKIWDVTGGIGTLAIGKGFGSVLGVESLTAGWLTTFTVGNTANPNAGFTGHLTLTGIGPIGVFNATIAGGLLDSTWNVNGPITSLKGGFMSASDLEATSIGTLAFGTWMDGNLQLNGSGTGSATVLGSATIGGGVTGDSWSLSGGIGTLTVNKGVGVGGGAGNFDVIDFIANGGIGTLDVKGNVDAPVTASSIGTLTVGGNFTGDLELQSRWGATALNSATITGNLTSKTWNLQGGIGTLVIGGTLGDSAPVDPLDQTLIDGTSAGTITVGGGFYGTLDLDGRGIVTTNTLGTLEVKGADGFGMFSGVTVDGGIGIIKAPLVNSHTSFTAGQIGTFQVTNDMRGDLTLSGVGSVNSTVLKTATFGSVSEGWWELMGGIDSLTTTTGEFAADIIGASFVNKINVKTDYTGELGLIGTGVANTWITSAVIGGNLASDSWILADGSFVPAHGGIGSLTVGGNVTTDISAGFINTLITNGRHSGDLTLTGHWRSANTLGAATIKCGLGSVSPEIVADTNWTSWNITGGIGSLTVTGGFGNENRLGPDADTLTADFIGTLAVTGNTYADVGLNGRETGSTGPALNTAKFTGDFRASSWNIEGDVNSFVVTGLLGDPVDGSTQTSLVAHGGIKTLSAGKFSNAFIGAGGYFGIPTGNDGPFVNLSSRIGSIAVTGTNGSAANPLVSNTDFAAPGITSAALKWINDFSDSGLYALSPAIGGGGIGKVTYSEAALKWTWPATTSVDAIALIHVLGTNAE